MEKIPADLRKALMAVPKAKSQWDDLTSIAQRDFISWIESAKQPETRKRRIDRARETLAAGKRRPCCYSIVPMDLYQTLNAAPKAKAHWRTLSPNERRDFADWIESAKRPIERERRIEKVRGLLTAGKRRP